MCEYGSLIRYCNFTTYIDFHLHLITDNPMQSTSRLNKFHPLETPKKAANLDLLGK